MAKVGNMPGAIRTAHDWDKDWEGAIEFAQAHPGVPVVPDGFENIREYRAIAIAIQDRSEKNRNHPAQRAVDEALQVLGGSIQVFARMTEKKKVGDKILRRGDVWFRWTPSSEEG